MIITEPRWKSLIVETTTPIFTPEQCQMIIEAGHKQPREDGQVGGGKGGTVDTQTRLSHISWIPFNVLPEMYKTLEKPNSSAFKIARTQSFKKQKPYASDFLP